MTSPALSPLLPAALDILDRADARADELRALVQASGTTHPPEVIEHALSGHLAAVAPALAKRPLKAAAFGWNRPQEAAEHHALLAAEPRSGSAACQVPAGAPLLKRSWVESKRPF